MMIENTSMMEFLREDWPQYYAKALELRDAVSGWLSYIPQTFPHYTRHTIEHSEEIVTQASNLLFVDADPSQPTVGLSGIEAYCLIVAAFLHDAGMVTSDEEKLEILRSEEWSKWAGKNGGGAKRFEEIERFRDSNAVDDAATRNFLADIQIRFLLAEFVRKRHHFRSARLIRQHQSKLARFAFDDQIISRTVSDICESHGLPRHELNDSARFPDRRTIRGETINVRFVSLILRIADLLDMSFDRACPLLLNAASPLPAESLAHWTQYQRITHRLVAPDRIEVSAECQSHEEHRYLQDWCSWLVDEIADARTSIGHSQRHTEWLPPLATIDGPDPTIRIRPAPQASYVPSEWTLELDPDIVFDRLVYDLHASSKVFVRELIQNSLDAVRCRIFLDLAENRELREGDFPSLDAETRENYPLMIELAERQIVNPLSGEEETRQVFSIDDLGIGMNTDVIEKYFLQIGRSFYSSDEFNREFGFFASSQFGIGFLSVFAVGDHILVETLKTHGGARDGPIRMHLTGPRNYLLTERGFRSVSGTRIEITLKEGFESGELPALVERWCKRVEFPIFVDDMGTPSVIRSETAEQFEYAIPDVTREDAYFKVLSYPIDRPGIDGELYVFSHVTQDGESWADLGWARFTYPSLHPQASAPEFPSGLFCVNGISTSLADAFSVDAMTARLDVRSRILQETLTRGGPSRHRFGRRLVLPEIETRWEELLSAHLESSALAKGEDSWTYKQRLIRFFKLSTYWDNVPGTIEYIANGKRAYGSLLEFVKFPEFSTVTSTARIRREQLITESNDVSDDTLLMHDLPYLSDYHILHLAHRHRKKIFDSRSPSEVSFSSGTTVVTWALRQSPPMIEDLPSRHPVELVSLQSPAVVGFSIHLTTDSIYHCALLNADHEIIKWLVHLKDACADGQYGLSQGQFDRLVRLLLTPVRYGGLDFDKFQTYVHGWTDLADLPKDLQPPKVQLEASSFVPPSS